MQRLSTIMHQPLAVRVRLAGGGKMGAAMTPEAKTDAVAEVSSQSHAHRTAQIERAQRDVWDVAKPAADCRGPGVASPGELRGT